MLKIVFKIIAALSASFSITLILLWLFNGPSYYHYSIVGRGDTDFYYVDGVQMNHEGKFILEDFAKGITILNFQEINKETFEDFAEYYKK